VLQASSDLAQRQGFNMPGMAPDWSHQASFEASPVSASRARAFVSHHLIDHRLLYLVDPVRLVASELATNALVHAQTVFNVTLAAWEKTVLLTVRDGSLALPSPRVARAMDLSGRGLEIVGIVAQEWGVEEDRGGSKSIWASFTIRTPREVVSPLA
jgi:anti-sigma regulatory factor (Ser/Thr protein kinase)